jgi:hypothetical protein
MFIIKFPSERTRITFTMNFLINNYHMHFRKFTFWATHIFLNVFIKTFLHVLLVKLSIYNIIGVIFSTCFFENSLRSFLKSKKFENILFISSKMFCNLIEIDNISFDTVSFTLNFELHFGHSISIVIIFYVRWNVQHF